MWHARRAGYDPLATNQPHASDIMVESNANCGQEQALRDSQALYQSLVDNLPMCLARKDREGVVTFANREFYRYSGKTPADILGKTDFDFYPFELASKYRQDDLRVMETGETLSDIEAHLTPAGEPKFVQVFKAPVADANGQAIGVQVLFWDVSDRKLAEEQVREGTLRKRAIFESALDCIIIIDQRGTIVDFNRAAEKTFGHRRDDVVGQNMESLLFPKQVQRLIRESREHYQETHEGDFMIGHRTETLAVRKSGEPFDVEMALQAIPMSGAMMFAVFLRDVTERKRAQEELATKNKDLETLLYVTSHDLREPLRAIEGFSRLVKDRYRDVLDAKGNDYLQRIIEGARQLDCLLEDVLMLSRAQRMVHPNNALAAKELMREVLKQLEAKIETSRATIVLHDNLPTLKVDRRWARQALYNLMANALKFTRGSEPPLIDVRPYSPLPGEPDGVGVEVHDRGPGVALPDAERIFGLFQRAVGNEVEGSGAGLAIVRQVAVRHGGDAWVRSRAGGGSEFVLNFGPIFE